MKLHRLLVRLPSALYGALKKLALLQGGSINTTLIELLEKALQNQELSWRANSVPALNRALKTIQQALGHDLVGIVLFGSVARGQSTENSDIDLLIVLGSAIRIDRDLYETLYSHLKQIGCAGLNLSLHLSNIPSVIDSVDGFLLEIALEGVVLFECDFLVSRFFMRLRKLIVSGCFVRESVHGHPYWLLPTAKDKQTLLQ